MNKTELFKLENKALFSKNVRQLALVTILKWQLENSLTLYSPKAFSRAEDASLYRLLVQRVIRHQRRLIWVLKFLHQGKKLDQIVMQTLLLGFAQLEEDRVKPHAAVNETVALVEWATKPHLKAVVNAILRKWGRQKEELEEALEKEELVVKNSMTNWMVKRWVEFYGKDKTEEMLKSVNTLPQIHLVANPKIGSEGLVKALTELEFECTENPIQLSRAKGLFDTDLAKEGNFLVQDVSAQRVIHLMEGLPKKRVLDACASPGGKMFHLEWKYAGEVENLVGLELEEHRIKRLTENQKTFKSKAKILQGDAKSPTLKETFDLILVDAPCSATGTIRKHPEIKWTRKPEDFLKNQQEQLEILQGLNPLLEVGGHFVYSTCSLEEEENQEVVRLFLEQNPNFKLIPVASSVVDESYLTKEGIYLSLPNENQMGGFAAILQKLNA